LFGNFLVQVIGVITLVCNGGVGLQSIDEFVGVDDVVFLAWSADQPNRVA
jgi:hypothetical protein